MGVGRTDTMEGTSEEYSDSEEYDGESSSYSDSDVDGVDEKEEEILREMEHIPFDVLLKTKESVGTLRHAKRGAGRPPGKAATGTRGGVGDAPRPSAKAKKGKHMPKEISSKRTYDPFRESAEETKRRKRDPRFDRMADDDSGRAGDRARKNYSFVFDEIIPEEEKELRQTLKKVKGEGSKQRIQGKLKKLQTQVDHHKSEKRRSETTRRATGTVKTKSGKRFFLKKSELKKQLLLDKFNELKKKGKLEDYLAKKRRRNASKEHKSIPFNRRQ